ncbi:hypothetical protein [uncultured Allomuricauda sp.]|uniref:hypothetical protein n=1 Tax=Flagellimonas sp. W118 TaxID=3410791 RepID=UPI0026152141|nr:hypothetical protein [uncultured Allomuricauda sp.]
MKKGTIYFVLVLLCSCAGRNKESMNEIVDYEVEARHITIEELASQKLKDHIELLKIRDDYPEFGTSLTSSSDTLTILSFFDPKTILDLSQINIRQIGKKEKVSNSIERIKFLVNISSSDDLLKDSVAVYIKTSEILIDGKLEVSREFFFKRD